METVNRKRSAVWNHFMENGPKKAKCSYCSSELSVSGGNVGNLNRHLRTKHPTIKLVEERQPPIGYVDPDPDQTHIRPLASVETQDLPGANGATTSSQPSIKNYTQSKRPLPPRLSDLIDEQLVKMIAKGHYPFVMVEDVEFKKLISLLNPQYALPTRKTISESILPKLYNTCLEKVKSEVQEGEAFCLTTDGWTSINNDSFIALTVHYISATSDETKFKSNLIGCVEYNERHTSENLTAFLRDKMAEWNIAGYTTAIASDNAANITAAIRDTNRWHIPCLAHSINLCVQAALMPLSETLLKIKSIVEFFKRSSHAQHKLREMQKQLNLAQLKLKQDVPTRWNSTYDMLQRLLSARDAVIATIAIMRRELALDNDDWGVIESAAPILKLFYDITVEISAEKNVSLAKVIPLCGIMKNHVNAHLNNNTLPTPVQLMLKTIEKQLEKRFSNIENHVLYSEATILDPRFKNKGFIQKNNFDQAVATLKRKVGKVQQTATTTELSTSEPSTSTSATKTSIWDQFDKEVAKLTPTNPLAAGIVELDKYLQEPFLQRSNDPLRWWHERRSLYPILFKYALKRLHLVATSVPCERIFSKAGHIMNERRTRLTTKKLSQLLFVSSNCK